MTNIMLTQQSIFCKIKTIPFLEVLKTFYGEEPDRSGKILCPFHSEKTPSFQVYDDCGHCFGCGWHGDGIDFVAALERLPLIKAARLIAQKFNLAIDRPLTIREQKIVNNLQEKRKLTQAYREIEEKTFRNMADFRSLTLKVIETAGLDNLSPKAEKAAHLLPQVESLMQILTSGAADEKLQLLREGVLLKWAKMT